MKEWTRKKQDRQQDFQKNHRQTRTPGRKRQEAYGHQKKQAFPGSQEHSLNSLSGHTHNGRLPHDSHKKIKKRRFPAKKCASKKKQT